MAAMLRAYREYFSAVANSYIEKETGNRLVIEQPRQKRAHRRTNLRLLWNASRETRHNSGQLSRISAMLATSHRFMHAVMALEAGLPLLRRCLVETISHLRRGRRKNYFAARRNSCGRKVRKRNFPIFARTTTA